MLKRNNKLLLISLSLLPASLSFAGGDHWIQDFEAAKKMAVEEKKDLLIDFTGSDWCPPCKDLTARVLSQEAFISQAKQNYVLVELDYPNDKSEVSAEIIAQNEALMEKYEITGFPTILLTDAQGRPFGQAGHRPGSPEDYLIHLGELRESKAARDTGFEAAEKAEGVEKSKALYAGLQAIPEEHWSHYDGVIEDIKANDPEDKTGFSAAEAKKIADAEASEKLQVKMKELKGEIDAAMQADDNETAVKIVDDFVARENLEGALKQQALAIKVNIFLMSGKLDDLESVCETIIAVEPEGNYSKMVREFKDVQLPQLKKERDEKAAAAAAAVSEKAQSTEGSSD